MSRKFRAGDIVKLEGELVEYGDSGHNYHLMLDLGNNYALTFTKEGKYRDDCIKTLELVKAAPVEIEIGKEYVVNGSKRVPLEILDGRVFYRVMTRHDTHWGASDCTVEGFHREFIND